MPFETLETRLAADAVALLTFNRPQTANALNRRMGQEIKAFFDSLPTAFPEARAVILTGQGKHFCAGADLKERSGMSEDQWHEQHDAFESALRALLDCPLPVMAAVNGAAFGGGLELALACDFIYASDTARFAFTETTLGIMPGLGGTQTLPRAVGTRRAKELLLTGRVFSADEASTWGMVNKLCAADTLIEESIACAHMIATNAPLAVRRVKASITKGSAMPLREALACELEYYHTLLATKDRHEGINAFNEKRKAVFTGS